MSQYRLYVFFKAARRSEESDFLVFPTYDDAVRGAQKLEADIARNPDGPHIVSLELREQRLSFIARDFARLKILSEDDDPNVPSFGSIR